jgi:rubredoxin
MGKFDEYHCNGCGFVFPKKGATISGFENHPNGLHIHCPNCGELVDQFVKIKMVS